MRKLSFLFLLPALLLTGCAAIPKTQIPPATVDTAVTLAVHSEPPSVRWSRVYTDGEKIEPLLEYLRRSGGTVLWGQGESLDSYQCMVLELTDSAGVCHVYRQYGEDYLLFPDGRLKRLPDSYGAKLQTLLAQYTSDG